MVEDDPRRFDAGTREVVVARVSGRIGAEPVLAALRANGIAARTRGEAAGELYGLTLDGMGEVSILVREDQAEQARELLRAGEHGDLRLADEDSTGP